MKKWLVKSLRYAGQVAPELIGLGRDLFRAFDDPDQAKRNIKSRRKEIQEYRARIDRMRQG